MPKKKLRNCTSTINDVMNLQGRGNGFYSGGARIIGKVRFWQFSKNLLNKCSIFGGEGGAVNLNMISTRYGIGMETVSAQYP